MTTLADHPPLTLARPDTGWHAGPLDVLRIAGANGPAATVVVRDGAGHKYLSAAAAPSVEFAVGGALGEQTVQTLDSNGCILSELRFTVDAQTSLEDGGGHFQELFGVLHKTLCCYSPTGESTQRWHGREYRMFVHWILDHFHTAKGMQYFSDATAGLVDLLAETQREDGMIWSFADSNPTATGYFESRDEARNFYTRHHDGLLLVRQPAENHCEYTFVSAMYLAWKGSADDAWMRKTLDAAVRALDYGVADPARWSEKFGLLKRGYTIDSWDFQIADEFTVHFPIGTAMRIDPARTKFGVFFGDNTGYAQACEELAEMLAHAERAADAARFRQRASDIRARLDALAWNGRFYTHHVEEDPAVKRQLGVDETTQVAMSNAYSLSRGMTHEQCAAVLRTYQDLRAHAPEGSPGEWYAIYPPFERGFGPHSERWQYMNGGVHGHAAGELARGAFEHGFEHYGAEILSRVLALAKKTDGIVHFAYTGAVEPAPPPPQFTTVCISGQVNMDLAGEGAPGVPGWMDEQPDNDLRNMPVGPQIFEGVPYQIVDPATNGRRSAVAVARRDKFPSTAEIPVGGRKAGAVYLLHAANGVGPSKVAGAVMIRYEDGSEHETYILQGRHMSSWWFPKLEAADAGVAWVGPNPRSVAVGVSWTALPNPHPDQAIQSIVISAAGENRPIYAVLGITLSDRPRFTPVELVSHGGPDNWAGATCMLALMQGLAGVQDQATAFRRVRLSPRWLAAGVDAARVTVRYPASRGYLTYRYHHDALARCVEITLTGSGDSGDLRVLLPGGTRGVRRAMIDGKLVVADTERVEESFYATLAVPLGKPAVVRVDYV